MQNSHYFPFYFGNIGYLIPSFIRTPPGIKNTPYGVFFIPVGVVVWTKRSQSAIAGFGARGAKTSPLAKFESYVAKGAHRAAANWESDNPFISVTNNVLKVIDFLTKHRY